MKRKKSVSSGLLSPLENEVMAVLWRHRRQGTVEVTEFVNAQRPVALSSRTVATILTRLETKGLVDHTQVGRAFLFSPTMTEKEFVNWHSQRAVANLVKLYGPELAVAGFVETTVANPTMMAHLNELLDRLDEDEA